MKISSKHKTEYLIFFFGFFYFLFFSRYGIDINDEGFHLYVSNLIANGSVPYKDFVLHATPLSFYLQALIFKIFSPSIIVGRLTVVCLGTYIVMLLFKITKYILNSDRFAAISSVLFIFWGVAQMRFPWYGWYGLASALTFAYFGLRYFVSGKNIYLFLMGIFCGAAFLIKQNLGTACLSSYIALSGINFLFFKKIIKSMPYYFLKKGFIFIMGMVSILAPAIFYFFTQNSIVNFVYYTIKFAASGAAKRFIFNPFPHIKPETVLMLFVFFIFSWLLYGYFWSQRYLKKFFLFLTVSLLCIFSTIAVLLIIKINEVDKIYALDYIKTGAVNGFFNIGMLGVFFGIFIVLKRIFYKKYDNKQDGMILFLALFSILYIWSSLCISRDHLHLVLGMPPAYVFISFMAYDVVQKAQRYLSEKNKDNLKAKYYSNLILCVFPVLFMCYFGFFTTLKNEGFRSISEPILNMHSKLELNKANGIIVTKEDKNMIEGIVKYIEANTNDSERIYSTYNESLFLFLSGRSNPSFYYMIGVDIFRTDKQEEVIRDIERYHVKLVITEKSVWDNSAYHLNENNNPLSFRIWKHLVDNYSVIKEFGRYYILKRNP